MCNHVNESYSDWTGQLAWDESVGRRTVPVRMLAQGNWINRQGTKLPFNHQYEFFDFEDNVNPRDFLVGVVYYSLPL